MASTERFGNLLREWRQRRRLSQEVLGEKIGSDGPRVHRLEKGAENPTLETLDKIALALEIDVSELLIPRSEGDPGHATTVGGVGGGAGLADSLGRALREYEKTGQVPTDWRGDVLIAIFALTRALQRPDIAAEPGGQIKEA